MYLCLFLWIKVNKVKCWFCLSVILIEWLLECLNDLLSQLNTSSGLYVYTKPRMHDLKHYFSRSALDWNYHLFWTIYWSWHLWHHKCSVLEIVQWLQVFLDSQSLILVHTLLQSHLHPCKRKIMITVYLIVKNLPDEEFFSSSHCIVNQSVVAFKCLYCPC